MGYCCYRPDPTVFGRAMIVLRTFNWKSQRVLKVERSVLANWNVRMARAMEKGKLGLVKFLKDV